jgi:protocatechuate 3,4-dioxygenase beta subunit
MNMLTIRPKCRRFTLAMLLAVAGVGLCMQARAQSEAGGFRIAGKVVSSTAGTPLPQTRVTISSVTDRSVVGSLLTTADGSFEFKHLVPGKYSLQAARRGFISSFYDQHERYNSAIVAGGEVDSEHLIFRLVPQAVLTGRVVDESGEPIRRANVTLYRQDQSLGVGLISRFRADRTDDRGTYEFAGLPAGNYFISVNTRPWYALSARSIPNGDGTVTTPEIPASFDVTYPTTYYPDTTESDDASPIPLRGGERLTADIHMSPVPALRILVRAPSDPQHGFGPPMLMKKEFDSTRNVTNQLMTSVEDPAEGVRAQNFSMLGPGLMELTGIPPGKYTAMMRDYSAGPRSGAMTEVDLTRSGQELDPSAGEPVSSAKLTVQIPGEPQFPAGLMLVLRGPDHKVVSSSQVDPKGEAQLAGVPPGKYAVIAASPTRDYAVVRIATGGNQTAGHGLEIPAGSTVEATVTLVRGAGFVEGFAKSKGKGVAGAMVVLVPNDPEANSELFRRDQSDQDGSFSLQTVVPGQYTIVAIENGWDLNWSQPGVIAHYLPQGKKVMVGAGPQGTVHLAEPLEVQPR